MNDEFSRALSKEIRTRNEYRRTKGKPVSNGKILTVILAVLWVILVSFIALNR